MITRIEEVKNLGSLQRLTTPLGGEYGLKEQVVIYAENAIGKTTLAAAFKSYAADDPLMLRARATLGQDEMPFVKFRLDDDERIFTESYWRNRDSDEYRIRVFDHDYVERNVFSNEITSDHLKTIHRIILGPEGRELNEKLSDLKRTERQARKRMREFDAELENRNKQIGREDYLDIEKKLDAKDVHARITALNKKLSAIKEKTKIDSLKQPEEINFKLGDFTALRKALKQQPDIHSDAKNRVLTRIEKQLNSAEHAETFLELGTKLISDDESCPFCSQSLKPVSHLIDDYKKFFDKASEEQKEDLVNRLERFEKWSPENQILKLLSNIQEANVSREKWDKYIDELPEIPMVSLDDETEKVKLLHTKCCEEFAKKKSSLKFMPKLGDLDELEKTMKRIAGKLSPINEKINKICSKIEKFQRDISIEDEKEIRVSLKAQEALLAALSGRAAQWREDYHKANNDHKKTEELQKDCEKEMGLLAGKTYREFQEGINEVLYEFGLSFSVDGMKAKSTKISSDVLSDFSFNIQGVPVAANKRRESSPCFRNTLSEGEKNALGFAFFITELKKTGKLDNTILILDDPLSSYDSDRHESTAWILSQLSKECRQLIVLTHRLDFAGHLYNQPAFDGQYFKLKTGTLENFDIKKELQHSHNKRMKYLIAASEGNSDIDDEKLPLIIRKVFEHVLWAKYSRHLDGVSIFGPMLGELNEKELCQEAMGELDRLNEQTKDHCHSESYESSAHSLTSEEWRNLARKALHTLDKV